MPKSTHKNKAAGSAAVVTYKKPAKSKVRGAEPLYSLNMRPRVSVVNRFNTLADELRMSNPELLEYLLDFYNRRAQPSLISSHDPRRINKIPAIS